MTARYSHIKIGMAHLKNIPGILVFYFTVKTESGYLC